jgi:hypothetical protein
LVLSNLKRIKNYGVDFETNVYSTAFDGIGRFLATGGTT